MKKTNLLIYFVTLFVSFFNLQGMEYGIDIHKPEENFSVNLFSKNGDEQELYLDLLDFPLLNDIFNISICKSISDKPVKKIFSTIDDFNPLQAENITAVNIVNIEDIKEEIINLINKFSQNFNSLNRIDIEFLINILSKKYNVNSKTLAKKVISSNLLKITNKSIENIIMNVIKAYNINITDDLFAFLLFDNEISNRFFAFLEESREN